MAQEVRIEKNNKALDSASTKAKLVSVDAQSWSGRNFGGQFSRNFAGSNSGHGSFGDFDNRGNFNQFHSGRGSGSFSGGNRFHGNGQFYGNGHGF